MRHCRSWAVLAAAFLAYGAAAQTTNNTNANANSASGSSSNSTSQGNVGNVTTNNLAPTSNANSNSSSSTSSQSSATNAGNSQTIVFNTNTPPATSSSLRSESVISGEQTLHQTYTGEQTIRYEYGDQTIKNTPSVSGAPLTTSNDTCMGSSSGSVNVPGFGLGLGSTWTDRNCVMLKNARELWNMGMKAAALALFCTDEHNRMALEITGFVCPQTQRANQLAAAQSEAGRVSAARLDAERQQRVAARTVRASAPVPPLAPVPPALPLELRPPLSDQAPQPAVEAPPTAASQPAQGEQAAEAPPPAAAPQPIAAEPAAAAPLAQAVPPDAHIVRVVSDPIR